MVRENLQVIVPLRWQDWTPFQLVEMLAMILPRQALLPVVKNLLTLVHSQNFLLPLQQEKQVAQLLLLLIEPHLQSHLLFEKMCYLPQLLVQLDQQSFLDSQLIALLVLHH